VDHRITLLVGMEGQVGLQMVEQADPVTAAILVEVAVWAGSMVIIWYQVVWVEMVLTLKISAQGLVVPEQQALSLSHYNVVRNFPTI